MPALSPSNPSGLLSPIDPSRLFSPSDPSKQTLSPSYSAKPRSMLTPVTPSLSPSLDVLSRSLDEGLLIIDKKTMKFLAGGGQGKIFTVEAQFIDPNTKDMVHVNCVLKMLLDPPRTLPPQPKSESPLFSAYKRIGDYRILEHNLLPLLGTVFIRDRVHAVLPLCQSFLDKQMEAISTLKYEHPIFFCAILLRILKDSLIALKYLHEERNMIHGDIKPDNMAFLRERVCLADFDSATIIHAQKVPQTNYYFKHPAAIEDISFATEAFNDMYALGTVLNIFLKPDEWDKTCKSKPFAHFLRDAANEYTRLKDAPVEEINLDVQRTDLSHLLENPIKLLSEIATSMTYLNTKHIPSASTLLGYVREIEKKLYEKHTNLNSQVNLLFAEICKKPTAELKTGSRRVGLFPARTPTRPPDENPLSPQPTNRLS